MTASASDQAEAIRLGRGGMSAASETAAQDRLDEMVRKTSWINTGNGESSAIVYDPDNVGNYKALVVKLWSDGRWRAEVNGEFRGWAATRDNARRKAIAFAMRQITGADQ